MNETPQVRILTDSIAKFLYRDDATNGFPVFAGETFDFAGGGQGCVEFTHGDWKGGVHHFELPADRVEVVR